MTLDLDLRVRDDRPTWAVGPVRRVVADDGWQGVEALVDGHPVRVERADGPLSVRPEAFLTAMAPLALAAGADLAAAEPVDGMWHGGLREACSRIGAFLDIDEAPTVRSPVVAGLPPEPPTGATGLCFTGGVDSFWSLLRGGEGPTHLVYVLAYDLPLDDHERVTAQVRTLRAVAAATGLGLLLLRTDLRQHPHVAHLRWDFHHGAALAAAGIWLSDELDRLVIPPSYPDDALIPWGSRPDLDHLWSLPGRVAIAHGSSRLRREARVREIAGSPLVHAHLRVCWQRLEPGVNCGICEKCVRTRVMLAAAGALEATTTFPRSDLAADVVRLAPLAPPTLPFWRHLDDPALGPDVRAAVAELLRLS